MAETNDRPSLKAVDGGKHYGVRKVSAEWPGFFLALTPANVDGHLINDAGVYRLGFDGKGNPRVDWISTEVRVTAHTVDPETRNHGLLLEIKDGKQWVEASIPKSLLHSPKEVAGLIGDLGGTVEPEHSKHMAKYLTQEVRRVRKLKLARKPGWVDDETFVFPGRTIGKARCRFDPSALDINPFESAGTLEETQTHILSLCPGNPTLIHGICVALSGALLKPVGLEGGGFHYVGDSSSGKTLILKVAGSVYGVPERMLGSWDKTNNGLEAACVSRNHTVAIFDEISRISPKELQGNIYKALNGTGRGRMDQYLNARETKTWLVNLLSSGEHSSSVHAGLSGDVLKAGAQLRMIDVDAGERRYRAFDDIHGFESAKAFHDTLTRLVGRHYGVIGPAFIEALIERASPEEIRDSYQQNRQAFSVSEAQAARVSDRFALCATAGELGIKFGVLPWEPGTALNACRTLFYEWMSSVGGGNAEDRQILQCLNDFILKFGDSRFTNLANPIAEVSSSAGRAGYYEVIAGKQRFFFTGSALQEAAPGFHIRRIIKTLDEFEVLFDRDIEPGRIRNQKTKSVGPGARKVKLFAIDPEKLNDHFPLGV